MESAAAAGELGQSQGSSSGGATSSPQHVTGSHFVTDSKPQKQRPMNNKAFELFEKRGIIIGPVSARDALWLLPVSV